MPGILTIRLGRSTADQSRRVSAVVTAGSRAARGETSIETKPSPPSDDVIDRAEEIGGVLDIVDRYRLEDGVGIEVPLEQTG